MNKAFVTSDTHFYHGNIIKYSKRFQFCTPKEKEAILAVEALPYPEKREAQRNIHISSETISRMNTGIIRNINEVVGADDVLYHLGDFCFGGRDSWIECRNRILCKNIFLCTGNHDKDIPKHLFSDVYPIMLGVPIQYNCSKFVINHYAMKSWLNSNKGVIHLYGHWHGNNPEDPTALSMDVGVDCNDCKPFAMDDIIKKMEIKRRNLRTLV